MSPEHVPRRRKIFTAFSIHLSRLLGRSSLSSKVSTSTNTAATERFPSPRSRTGFFAVVYAIATSSWLNYLLVVVPIAIASYLIRAHPVIVFVTNVIAVVPLSSLLTYATENISRESGDAIGALLNVTFGNLVEIILLAALYHDKFEVVQASILGSILVNLLLILGIAILAGSYYNHEQRHDQDEAQGLACLLSVSVFSLLVPNAFYHSFTDDVKAEAATLILSRVSSLMLLAIYILYIFFQIRRSVSTVSYHPPGFTASRRTSGSHSDSLRASFMAPRSIRFQDEESVDGLEPGANRNRDILELSPMVESDRSEEGHDDDHLQHHSDGDEESRGLMDDRTPTTAEDKKMARAHSIYQHHTQHRSRSRESRRRGRSQGADSRRLSFAASSSNLSRFLLGSNPATDVEDIDSTSDVDAISETMVVIGRKTSILILVMSSALVAVCAEFLVNTLDDMVSSGPFSQAFIGLIILPVAGNCAELLTAIIVAARGNFDLAIGVSVGSSVQISLFVTPLVVLSGWIMQKEMTMYFGLFEIVALFATTFLVNCLILCSRTNALEGSILCACYFIMAAGAFLFPRSDSL
ncbi:calcium/proton exchanger [Exophiala spinifera]|uniref:Calcium/proton exchanger n=1 Tax=Exophiala spinifera TaxID=91928 RepID=A0A0D2BCX5_9EURO|nr:calcium/proton exchanger [Exophiala spinifera]KIW16818.1 calcium/proton exchanger [Exophiala spinifera]